MIQLVCYGGVTGLDVLEDQVASGAELLCLVGVADASVVREEGDVAGALVDGQPGGLCVDVDATEDVRVLLVVVQRLGLPVWVLVPVKRQHELERAAFGLTCDLEEGYAHL